MNIWNDLLLLRKRKKNRSLPKPVVGGGMLCLLSLMRFHILKQGAFQSKLRISVHRESIPEGIFADT